MSSSSQNSQGIKIKIGTGLTTNNNKPTRSISQTATTPIEHSLPNIDPSCAQSLLFDLCSHKISKSKRKRNNKEPEVVVDPVIGKKEFPTQHIKQQQQQQPQLERSNSGLQVEFINGKIVVQEASLVIIGYAIVLCN